MAAKLVMLLVICAVAVSAAPSKAKEPAKEPERAYAKHPKGGLSFVSRSPQGASGSGKHKRSAPSTPAPKPKKSESFQSVELGLPRGGISKYSTKIINEKKVELEDRRKTPEPEPKKEPQEEPKKHKRSAPPPPPEPKPKKSESFQSVELGLPRGGISKYSTKIINEKEVELEDRRKTPEPAPKKEPKEEPKKHKRSAPHPPPPKPKKSESFQSVELGLPREGISKYSTKIINEKKAELEDRRKTPNPPEPKGH